MPRNLDLAALRSLVAVVETGGVTKAARRLNLTQSAVSMQIKRLEESLGIELLARAGRGVGVTHHGEELVSHARKLIALNDDIWERMTTPTHEGEVTLGIPHDIIYPSAPIVMRRFSAEYPGVRVSLVSHPSKILLEQMEAGQVDVILTTEEQPRPGGETLTRGPLVWVGAPGGRAWLRRPIPIAYERICAFRAQVFKSVEAAGLEWDWVIDTSNYDAVVSMIAADLAVSAVLRGTAPHALEEIAHGGELPELPENSIILYVGKGPGATFAGALADCVRQVFREQEAVAVDRRRVA
ncbi:MAG: LysR family transcriptional regulator [Pseudomonadota bacterium]